MITNAFDTQNALKVSAIKGDWLRYYPHALGIMLGTGYDEFKALCGVSGLAKEHGSTIEILAVHSDNPGSGQFRSFITALKESFGTIFIWEVWNPELEGVLRRYGFSEAQQIEDGETLTGFRWESPSVENGSRSDSASYSPKEKE